MTRAQQPERRRPVDSGLQVRLVSRSHASIKVNLNVIDPDAHVVENERVWDYLEKRSGGHGGEKPVRKKFLLIRTYNLVSGLIVNPSHAQQTGKVLA